MNQKTVKVQHRAGMALIAQTGSNHVIQLDDRTGDTGPRPTELVLAGLGGCAAMDVVSILRKQRQDFIRLDVDVRATQRDAYPQIFTTIDVAFEIEGPGVTVKAVRQAIKLAVSKYCSVNVMLAAGATTIHHRYRVIGTGTTPFDESGDVMTSGPHSIPDAASIRVSAPAPGT